MASQNELRKSRRARRATEELHVLRTVVAHFVTKITYTKATKRPARVAATSSATSPPPSPPSSSSTSLSSSEAADLPAPRYSTKRSSNNPESDRPAKRAATESVAQMQAREILALAAARSSPEPDSESKIGLSPRMAHLKRKAARSENARPKKRTKKARAEKTPAVEAPHETSEAALFPEPEVVAAPPPAPILVILTTTSSAIKRKHRDESGANESESESAEAPEPEQAHPAKRAKRVAFFSARVQIYHPCMVTEVEPTPAPAPSPSPPPVVYSDEESSTLELPPAPACSTQIQSPVLVMPTPVASEAPEDDQASSTRQESAMSPAAPANPSAHLAKLPNELLLQIFKESMNPFLALVSKQMYQFRFAPGTREGVIIETFRNPFLAQQTPHAAHHALRRLLEDPELSFNEMLDIRDRWLERRVGEVVENFLNQHVGFLEVVARRRIRRRLARYLQTSDPLRRRRGVKLRSKEARLALVVIPVDGASSGEQGNVNSANYQPASIRWRVRKGDDAAPAWQDERWPCNIGSTAAIPDKFLSGPWSQEEGNKFSYLLRFIKHSTTSTDAVQEIGLSQAQLTLASAGLKTALRGGHLAATYALTGSMRAQGRLATDVLGLDHIDQRLLGSTESMMRLEMTSEQLRGRWERIDMAALFTRLNVPVEGRYLSRLAHLLAILADSIAHPTPTRDVVLMTLYQRLFAKVHAELSQAMQNRAQT